MEIFYQKLSAVHNVATEELKFSVPEKVTLVDGSFSSSSNKQDALNNSTSNFKHPYAKVFHFYNGQLIFLAYQKDRRIMKNIGVVPLMLGNKFTIPNFLEDRSYLRQGSGF